MLFNITVDVLQMMIEKLNGILLGRISGKLSKSIMALQYADGTAIIAKVDEETLISLKIVIRMFTAVSGLSINYEKSVWMPINVVDNELDKIDIILGCKRTNFPIIYLRMPLSLNKPTRDLYLPLLQKFENKLEGWKVNLFLEVVDCNL